MGGGGVGGVETARVRFCPRGSSGAMSTSFILFKWRQNYHERRRFCEKQTWRQANPTDPLPPFLPNPYSGARTTPTPRRSWSDPWLAIGFTYIAQAHGSNKLLLVAILCHAPTLKSASEGKTVNIETLLTVTGVPHHNAKLVSKQPVRVFHAVVGACARLSLQTCGRARHIRRNVQNKDTHHSLTSMYRAIYTGDGDLESG